MISLGVRNPCFAPQCLVTLADGSQHRVDQVKAGDILRTPSGRPARVRCVVETLCAFGETELVSLSSGLVVTPYHPIRMEGKWRFPCELGTVQTQYALAPLLRVVAFG